MNRSLEIDIKKGTWPRKASLPTFPSTFHSGVQTVDIHVPSALLMIGFLTTPIATTGVSLSEFWAWVRYLAAISADPDLRLTQSFADLDAHQKTILSDDFGMGLPMLWLNDKLQFDRIVDGRYFMQRFAASTGATQHRAAKRGPNKTPDFVARDLSGVWHVVECKGTQSGVGYSSNQLGGKGPPPVGGVAQKLSIIFPPGHTGQRLVCGLSIGVDGREKSKLTIIDPEPDEPLTVRSDQISNADDAATRGMVAKALKLAGFEATAEVTAAPLGFSVTAVRRKTKKAEKRREAIVAERDARARAELGQAETLRTKFDDGYLGRELNIDLPRPIPLGSKPVSRVIVRQGVKQDAISELREQPTVAEPTYDDSARWVKEVGPIEIQKDGQFSSFTIGGFFRSELILE
ncbi:MAG: hypothetical protein U9R07_10300 [Pseudomonadota bacterium]|nr:hypothetical protein [Pseudomonadota bacterium]